MNDEATRALIGRTVGGDPDTLDDLASWVRDTLQPIVEDVGATLNDLSEELPEVWFDQNSGQFLAMLRQGRNQTNLLADRLVEVGDLIAGTGPAIRRAQSNLDEVVDQAAGLGLEVTEEGIWSYYDLADEWQPKDVDIIAQWHDLCERADVALEPLATQLETMADSAIWETVLFSSGSLVQATTSRLLSEYEQGLDRSPELPRPGPFPFQRFGLLKRVVRVGGPLIDGLQAVNGLREGKRPDQVFIEFGIGAVGAAAGGVVGAGAVTALVAGSLLAGGVMGVVAILFVAGSTALSDYASRWYIDHVPGSVVERLRQAGSTREYENDGAIRFEGGVYGP